DRFEQQSAQSRRASEAIEAPRRTRQRRELLQLMKKSPAVLETNPVDMCRAERDQNRTSHPGPLEPAEPPPTFPRKVWPLPVYPRCSVLHDRLLFGQMPSKV